MDARQIQILLFPSARVAQRRLATLVQQGRIKRNTQTSPYFYYTVVYKDPLQRIEINWVRMWLDRIRKSWERISFDYNESTCTVINTVRNTSKEYRISHTKFKFSDENLLFINDGFINKIREEFLNE